MTTNRFKTSFQALSVGSFFLRKDFLGDYNLCIKQNPKAGEFNSVYVSGPGAGRSNFTKETAEVVDITAEAQDFLNKLTQTLTQEL